jgi:hypothetical protein
LPGGCVHRNTSLSTWKTTLLQKLTFAQVMKKFPFVYVTQVLISMCTGAGHWSLSWARWIQLTRPQSQYYPNMWGLHLMNVVFLLSFKIKVFLHIFQPLHGWYMSHPSHPPSFYHRTIFGEKC